MAAERRVALALLRGQIDAVDAGMRRLLALRRELVGHIAALKDGAGLPARDPERERAMTARAERDAAQLGLPRGSADALMVVALDASRPDAQARERSPSSPRWRTRVLWQRVLAAALARPLAAGAFDELAGRRIAVEVPELRFRICVLIAPRALEVLAPDAEAAATVRGALPDLLALVGRSEDADALFFQRRLQLTGDVELGLTLRNLLDRLPWEDIPLGLRIALSRGARLLARIRAPRRGRDAA
jgi:predicted lipid carrier protein YhbT/chorismate mutase